MKAVHHISPEMDLGGCQVCILTVTPRLVGCHPPIHSRIVWGHWLWWEAMVAVGLGERFSQSGHFSGTDPPQPDVFQVPPASEGCAPRCHQCRSDVGVGPASGSADGCECRWCFVKDAAARVSASTFSPRRGRPPGGAAAGTRGRFCSVLLEERFPQVNSFCL